MKHSLSAIVLFTFLLGYENLIHAQGRLWGITTGGGLKNGGVIFSADPDGANCRVEYNFKTDPLGYGPYGFGNHLTLASNGKLYGLLNSGGSYGIGVLYSFDPASNTYEKKIDFDSINGASPYGNGLFAASNGKLYGMTSSGGDNNNGVIFEYDPATNTLNKKFSFLSAVSGANPRADLVQALNGKLYGMASEGGANGYGVLFEFDPLLNIYTKKLDFSGTNGQGPIGGLFLASNGRLYGMAPGGASGAGVLFEYDPTGNVLTIKQSFDGINAYNPVGSLIEGENGKLYGMTLLGTVGNGVLFEYNFNTNVLTKKHDFSSAIGDLPFGNLVKASNGNLYGMTSDGGTNDFGVLFEFNPSTSTYANRVQFSMGVQNYGTLVMAANGKLYGASMGGLKGGGELFEFDPSTYTYVPKHELSASVDGAFPRDALTEATNRKLYGVASSGGVSGGGVLFEFDPTTKSYSKKFDFNSNDGISPSGKLLEASNNKLYGLTATGGANGVGALFEYDPTTNFFSKKFDFPSLVSNAPPMGCLIQSSSGKLYGLLGGTGALFEYDFVQNLYSKKIDFTQATGIFPTGGLVEAGNSRFYGLTREGGANNKGALYEYDPTSNTYTKKIDFPTKSGFTPIGSLVKASNGKLYGLTTGGGANGYGGVLFEYDPISGAYKERHDFDTMNGFYPGNGLIESSNGRLYGLTQGGGSANKGVLFEYDLSSNLFTKKADFTNGNGLPGENRLIFTSETVTAIEPNEKLNDLLVYPNPTKNSIYIKTSNWDDRYSVSISIIDITGRELNKSVNSNSAKGTVEFYVGNFSPGIYIVQARQGEKVTYKKFIKE